MNVQLVIVAALIPLVIVAGVLILWPDNPIAKKVAEYIPTVEVNYIAEVEYEVRTPGFIEYGHLDSVEIKNVDLIEKATLFSVGGFGIIEDIFGGGPMAGVIRIEAKNRGTSVITDRLEREVEVTEGLLDISAAERFTDDVKLGVEGSGRYIITVRLYDEHGEKLIDEDYAYKTI